VNKQMTVSLVASVLLLVAIIGFAAWKGNEPDTADQSAQQTNQTEGGDMLEGKLLEDFETVDEVSELKVIDLKEGDGEEVAGPETTVNAHYTGAIASTGVIFQSSYDTGSPIEFPLDGVIAGWTEGVPGMKVGGTRRLIIPADKAYGPAPVGYSYQPGGQPLGPLVFDITLEGIISQ